MTYEHIAMIPFLLDDLHLTPEEVAERDANPAQWAAQRYALPEHIFKAAAERHGHGSAKVEHPRSSANPTHPSASPLYPTTPRLVPRENAPALPSEARDLREQLPASSQPATSSPVIASPGASGPTSPKGSSPSGSYFSTVLSSPPSPNRMEVASTTAGHRMKNAEQPRSNREVRQPGNSMSSKKRGKMRA
ncbi:hypothetical protein OPT61_g685 [Boeremia exigua]|uniref:Uncharacterized protein n=1 Tax=Boeremia exigua TaxID=749465 RepID=A0ACC2IT13_9PLEO|nr:hypothetical protein OPT61_g685 [Boeremia exigua]